MAPQKPHWREKALAPADCLEALLVGNKPSQSEVLSGSDKSSVHESVYLWVIPFVVLFVDITGRKVGGLFLL